MADILNEKLGDSIYLLPPDWNTTSHFPSPRELQYKIILKDKADIPKQASQDMEESSDEEDKKEEEGLQKEITEEPETISQELYKMITLLGVSLKFNSERKIWNISSLSEKQLEKMMQKHEKELIVSNQLSFTRIFPGGFRVDSSNYDPIPGFMMGSQVIALNFQTNDLNLLLYLSRFMENGGIYSGYVLKPQFLRFGENSYADLFQKPKIELIIKVKTAQFLRPLVENEDVSDVIDPFIEVAIKGIEKDCCNKKTGTVMNNGLNPNFKGKNNKCIFKIHCPDMAMLLFSVFDENSLKNERVAWYALPVECLRSGYRMVPLRNCKNLDYFELSSIYCKIQIKKIG